MLIQFITKSELFEACPPPIAAAKLLPDWYRRLERQGPSEFSSDTARSCMPMFDVLCAGYIFRLPARTRVVVDKDGWRASTQGLGGYDHAAVGYVGTASHPAWQVGAFEAPRGEIYKWLQPWAVRLPEGYSALYTHPHNRPELPWYTLSGIVDDGYESPVNFPFVWTGGEGEWDFDAGTPIAQMIPYKREELWTASSEVGDLAESSAIVSARRHGYESVYWNRKNWRD